MDNAQTQATLGIKHRTKTSKIKQTSKKYDL